MSELPDDLTDEELEAYLDSLDYTCARCGEDSRGEAGVGDKFYCHRDERSCFMAETVGSPQDALTAAQNRAARAEAQSEVRKADMDYWRDRAQEFEAQIKAVREMHNADGVRWVGFPRADEQVAYCTYCQERSPCGTIRTLDGEG